MNKDKSYFEESFVNYSEQLGDRWGGGWRAYMKLRSSKIIKIIKKYVMENISSDIVEIGVASGDAVSEYIALIKSNYLGIDISETAVSICKTRFKDYLNACFQVGELPNISLANKVPCVICIDVLEYFSGDDKLTALQNIKDLLTENGVVLMQIPLENESELELNNLFSTLFEIKRVYYVYGYIWFNLFEKWLHPYALIYLNKRRQLGWIKSCIGFCIYYFLRSKFIVQIFFVINFIFFRHLKSHIIYVLNKNE